MVIVYLISKWSSRKTPSLAVDHDDLDPGSQLKEGRLESRADPNANISKDISDGIPPLDQAESADDRHSEYPDTVVTKEFEGQRDSGVMVDSTWNSSTNDVDQFDSEQQSVDQIREIPVLAVEIMPGENTAKLDNQVSGEDSEMLLMSSDATSDESNGNTDASDNSNGSIKIRGGSRDESLDESSTGKNDEVNGWNNVPDHDSDRETQGRNDGSQDKLERSDPVEESGGINHSIDEEAFGSEENGGSSENDPAFPYHDMLDQQYPYANKSDADARVEPTLDVEEDYQEDQTEHRESVIEGSAGFVYPKIDGFIRLTQIDYWAKIFGDRDVGRETVIAQYRAEVSSLSDKCRIFGQKVPDHKWYDVEEQSEGARFKDIVVSIQLAGPMGPVSKLELDNFVRMVEKMSTGTGRHNSYMADKKSAWKQARAIAEFIWHYDSVHLVNVKPFQENYIKGRDIERCAIQLGLEKGANNYFVRYKKAGKEKVSLYCMANMNETGEFDFEHLSELPIEGVTFFSRPAINRSPGAVFAEMVDTAKSFASRVQAEALSTNYQDLSQEDVDKIRRSIEDTANEMQALGLASGSEEAMRIFKSY